VTFENACGRTKRDLCASQGKTDVTRAYVSVTIRYNSLNRREHGLFEARADPPP
jgi:hypothetical protein